MINEKLENQNVSCFRQPTFLTAEIKWKISSNSFTFNHTILGSDFYDLQKQHLFVYIVCRCVKLIWVDYYHKTYVRCTKFIQWLAFYECYNSKTELTYRNLCCSFANKRKRTDNSNNKGLKYDMCFQAQTNGALLRSRPSSC